MQLLNIKRKAQAEDTKVSEIAFINELQVTLLFTSFYGNTQQIVEHFLSWYVH